MNTEPGIKNIVYADNVNEIKTNYMDENEMDYEDFENVDLEIIRSNISLPSPLFNRKPEMKRYCKYSKI